MYKRLQIPPTKGNQSLALVLRSRMTWPRIALTLIFIYACGMLVSYLCISNLLGPVDRSLAVDKVIQISHGTSAMDIGILLERSGVIKNAFLFRMASELNGKSHSLKAGAYSLNTAMSMLQILRKIASGGVIIYRVTIPEGYTLSQIARLWESKGLGKAEKFTRVSIDPTMQRLYNLNASSLEGYLFPDTYFFPYGISEREAVNEMLRQFNRKVSNITSAERLSELDLSWHEVVSLASIIEREAKVEEERAIISAVFHNRLKLGYKLESCATVLYGLGYPHRELSFEDLNDPSSAYNTYVYKGLPPGPICNPGLGSILAALNPSNDKYLYFVSKNDGTHYFTESYSDFLAAKRRYRSKQVFWYSSG